MKRLLHALAGLIAATLLTASPALAGAVMPQSAILASGFLKLKGGYVGGGSIPAPTCDFSITSANSVLTITNNPANAGKTICLLAAGSPFGRLEVEYAQASRITITSADRNNPVIVRGIEGYSGANNYTFNYLTVCQDTPRLNQTFYLSGVNNVTFDRLTFQSCTPGAHDYFGGRIVSGSSNVTIDNSRFHDLKGGVLISGSNNIHIEDNRFEDLHGDDAVQVETTNYIYIERNYITDMYFFWQYPEDPMNPNDHADAIQFLNLNASPTTAGHHIYVRDNTYVRGNGNFPGAQGLPFISPEELDWHWSDIEITGNRGYGLQNNGIRCISCDRVLIENNYIQGYDAPSDPIDNPSQINFGNTIDLTVRNNTATQFNNLSGNTGTFVYTGNTTIPYCDGCTP